MPLKAIFLGSLGTLAETCELQRRALNVAFVEAGLDWEWTLQQYRDRAGRGCCPSQIHEYAINRGMGVDAEAIHRRKAEIFRDLLGQVRMPPRPGLKGLIDATRRAGIDLALVTTTAPEDVAAMLVVTGLDRTTFAFVGDATQVEAPKPAPDIYHAALRALALSPDEAIAIEDTPESAKSATAAGVSCAAFPGAAHLVERIGDVPRNRYAPISRLPEPRIARRA